MPFWERAEAKLQTLAADRARVARFFLIAYWISMGVVLVGAVLIILSLTGTWRP